KRPDCSIHDIRVERPEADAKEAQTGQPSSLPVGANGRFDLFDNSRPPKRSPCGAQAWSFQMDLPICLNQASRFAMSAVPSDRIQEMWSSEFAAIATEHGRVLKLGVGAPLSKFLR